MTSMRLRNYGRQLLWVSVGRRLARKGEWRDEDKDTSFTSRFARANRVLS
jgi:hypothetical protein